MARARWAVTTHCVTSFTPVARYAYWIEPKRLVEQLPHYSFIEHIAKKPKGWDLEEFIAAVCVAIVLHSIPVDRQALLDSIERAREYRCEIDAKKASAEVPLYIPGTPHDCDNAGPVTTCSKCNADIAAENERL